MQTGLHRADLTYIGEAVSMIYAPVYYKDLSVYDGISGQRIAPMPDEAGLEFAGKPGAGEGRLSFLPSLCPQCGWDMEGEPKRRPHMRQLRRPGRRKRQFRKSACSCVSMQGDSFFLPFCISKLFRRIAGVARRCSGY